MTTRASDTARMCHRLPEDALAQCLASLPPEVFVPLRGAVIDAAIDEVDRLLGNDRYADDNIRRLRGPA